MKIKITIAIIALSSAIIAQPTVPYWKLGGNPIGPPPADGVNTTNNFLGTNATNSTFLKIGVRGSQDIMIDNNPAQLIISPTVLPTQQGGHWIGMGRIFKSTIGPLSSPTEAPQAHLHIHGSNITPYANFGSGIRSWFNTGTLYTENSDGMYVGLRTIDAAGETQATINWSDDAYGGLATNFLSFNFTGAPGALAGTLGGMELGRFCPTAGRGTLGVGNFQFFGPFTEPTRRVEILDADPATGLNTNTPQLRTTYTYSINPTDGVFTEFQTTNNGNMYFNTRRNTVEQNFGFHSVNPLNCVEIQSHAGNPYFPGSSSGLRFTNLKSTDVVTIPSLVNGIIPTKLLSVDNNGDVVLINGNIPAADNGISVNAGVVQLGVPCTLPGGGVNFPGLGATALSTDRAILIGDKHFWFADLNTNTGGIGVGGNPASVGFCGTGNTFEISANLNNSQYGNTNASGLRLTKLPSTSSVVANGINGVNSSKVLTVDGDGDVVLTDASSGIGNLCVNAPNPLLGNYQIPMAGNNFNYTMPALSTSQVNIGQTACATNPARLYVENDNLTSAGTFSTNGTFTTTPYAVYGKAINNAFNVTTVGVYGEAEVQGPNAQAIGVEGKSVFSSGSPAQNIGGKFTAANGAFNTTAGLFSISNSSSGTNYGIISDISLSVIPGSQNTAISGNVVSAGNTNIGGRFNASNAPIGNNYGVWASVPFSTAATADYAGYFTGNVLINGQGFIPGGVWSPSDKNIKTNVATVVKPLDLLLKLRPVTYNLDNAYAPQLNVDTAKTFGLIAQEVAAIIPQLVKDVVIPPAYDTLGAITTPSVALKSLNYTGLIPLTISAIQDINSRQNVMQTQINKTGLSDALVKTNINNFNALAKIKILNPVSYNFTNASVPQLTFTPQLDYGFVAQQLQTVYPELVDTLRVPAKYDSLGAVVNVAKVLKTVNYKAMSALLTRAIQEQQTKIDSLIHVTSKQDSINNAVQNQISNLTSMINACCSNPGAKTSNPSINQLDVELSDKDAIVLEQNVPNPFAEQTTITYNVPASVNKAQLLFFNATGQVIQTVDIKTRGKGKVNVFASDLSSGLYHYTLVADGKVVDSKKMVRE